MNVLPNEILLDIFTKLPQSYAVTICSTVCKNWNSLINQSISFHTIHIYSNQQLKKWIQLAKKKVTKNSDKPIGYYVKQLIFHFQYIPSTDIITELLVFPNLQQIDGLKKDVHSVYENRMIYFQLHQPTDFPCYPQFEEWKIKYNQVKNNLKSLTIYMLNEVEISIPQQQQQQQQQQHHHHHHHHQEEFIYMTRIRNYSTEVPININLLILPILSLAHLIKLKIDFTCKYASWRNTRPSYIIEHQTLETIHQSCPSLKSLSIENIYIYVPDDYCSNNIIKPTHSLKKLNIIGRICSPEYCNYIAKKYPQLESLSLHSCFFCTLEEEQEKEKQFEKAILNMFLQLTSLKKLTCQKNIYNYAWPYYGFFKWMNLPSNRLTHLEYRHPLTLNETKRLSNIDDIDFHNSNNIVTLPIQSQFNYLNRLTSLIMDLHNISQLSYTFLLSNIDTIIVSTTLQEIEMVHRNGPLTSNIYIYDWLAMFPNLLSIKISEGTNILDDSDIFDNYTGLENDKGKRFYQLHQLIKKRNNQQQQHNASINHPTVYKLKSLEISSYSRSPSRGFHHLLFKNGFDDLLKRCHQLKRLKLNNVTFTNPINPPNEIHFDISHLHLELLNIGVNYCNPFIDNKVEFQLENKIKTIKIHETVLNEHRVIDLFIPSDDKLTFNLNIKCKFIDALTLNNL